MNNKRTLIAAMLTAVVFVIPTITILAQQDEEVPEMGFFVTSTGLGDGGKDLVDFGLTGLCVEFEKRTA